MSTPLWRLDKMIAFPYHEEDKLRGSDASETYGSSDRKAAAGERRQMQELVLGAQGPVASVRLREATLSRRLTGDGPAFDPMAFATFMHEAIMGTDEFNSTPASTKLPSSSYKPAGSRTARPSASRPERLLPGKNRSNKEYGTELSTASGRR